MRAGRWRGRLTPRRSTAYDVRRSLFCGGAQIGPLGMQEMVFIFVLALLIFGPKKLPELGKTLGKAMTEFRRASNELKSTFDREMSNLERETESTTKELSSN